MTPSRVVKVNREAGIEEPFASFDRGEMDRVDVFRKLKGKKFEYFLVPIYPYQINGVRAFPNAPDRAIIAHKDEADWEIVDGTFEFLFSIAIHDYIEIIRSGDDRIAGYFKGVDRQGGQLTISQHDDLENKVPGIGTRKLLSFKKFTIDRLGRKFEVSSEVRTWRGKACT